MHRNFVYQQGGLHTDIEIFGMEANTADGTKEPEELGALFLGVPLRPQFHNAQRYRAKCDPADL